MPFAADVVAPAKTVTFTVTSLPRAEKGRKTLLRLIRMQPDIQRGLSRLSKRRAKFDNDVHQRGGRMWTSRARAPKLAIVQVGESFTLQLTPQVIPDLRSVEAHLEAKAGKAAGTVDKSPKKAEATKKAAAPKKK
jgi:hypothetical protein